MECAYGLFWNNGGEINIEKKKGQCFSSGEHPNYFFHTETDYCDYPGNVTCEVAEEELEALAPKRETFLYLTFDDGPYVGTTEVLDALKEEDIKVALRLF